MLRLDVWKADSGTPDDLNVIILVTFTAEKLLFMRILLALALLVSWNHAFAFESFISKADTTDPGMLQKGTAPAKMLAARHEFLNHNMRGALTLYREVIDTDPNNALALYRLAECHYSLKSYKLAVEYFDKAIAVDPNVCETKDFFRAQIHHRVGELDEALEAYQTFLSKTKSGKSLEYELCVEGIEQCKYAKDLMANPHNVKAVNLGREINSRYDDYTPSMSADGNLMVFTTRRGDVAGGQSAVDTGSDYKFFEDVYYSERDPETHEWTKAFPIEGKINSPYYDAVLSLAPDAKSMFVYRNNAGSAGDIFQSFKDEVKGQWSEPTKMPKPVNTSYFESSISLTADGGQVYFISERPGGRGQGDIWSAKRMGKDGWSSPENLGDAINSALDEKFVFVHPSGQTIFFASNGHQTMGSYDIFRSDLINGRWSVPVNLGYPVNTVNEESTFSLTADYKTLLIAAEYDDTAGERDIYSFDVTNHPVIKATGGKLWQEVEISVKEGGKAKKNANVTVNSAFGKKVFEGKTDNRGHLKVNLPSGSSFTFKSFAKSASAEVKMDIPASSSPEPFKVELKL